MVQTVLLSRDEHAHVQLALPNCDHAKQTLAINQKPVQNQRKRQTINILITGLLISDHNSH